MFSRKKDPAPNAPRKADGAKLMAQVWFSVKHSRLCLNNGRSSSSSSSYLFRHKLSKQSILNTGPAVLGHVKIALVITVVDFDQFSLHSTGTSLFCNNHT